jgi:hypothetical protein
MKPSTSATALAAFAASKGVDLHKCTPRTGLAVMFAFFDTVMADGCDGCNSDMLLFQWGTYDWGLGRNFEVNITRQFIENLDDQGRISQLRLDFRFEPTPDLVIIVAGNRWCTRPDGSGSTTSAALPAPVIALPGLPRPGVPGHPPSSLPAHGRRSADLRGTLLSTVTSTDVAKWLRPAYRPSDPEQFPHTLTDVAVFAKACFASPAFKAVADLPIKSTAVGHGYV